MVATIHFTQIAAVNLVFFAAVVWVRHATCFLPPSTAALVVVGGGGVVGENELHDEPKQLIV